jgi:hypothetical protein
MQIKIHLRMRGKLVFGYRTFFVQTQKARVAANETARENPTGKFGEIFPFYSFEKTYADLRGGRNFFQAHASHLSLTPKILTECGHRRSTLWAPYESSL